MNKTEILSEIRNSFEVERSTGRNSMGVSESYYNKYYLIGTCFEEDE
jgi:hypothetical protein